MRRLLIVMIAALLGLAWTGVAAAQNYPARAITVIVPFPAGGATDTLARFLAEKMRGILGQPVIIENVAGAAGSIGVGRAVRSTADGYTLSIGTSTTHMLTGGLYALQFDLLKDLEPVILIGSEPLLIVGRKSLPADDLKGLIAYLKANPDKASVGIAGVGATGHLTGISFQKETGTSFQFVPYRGNAGPFGGADRFHDRTVFELQIAGWRRKRQALCDHGQGAAAFLTGYSDRGRGGTARVLCFALVRTLGAEGYAEGYQRQAECHYGAGARRSRGERAFC
jgi:tripartite tricarboxylate transporter family receptor